MSETSKAKLRGRRLPSWLRKKQCHNENIHNLKSLLRGKNLNTVCESARCPNISECFSSNTATFMILGDICTRKCTFCAVKGGAPELPDPDEPKKIAAASKELNLTHVVVTSVTRDDLPDGGAGHFAEVVRLLKETGDNIIVEVLTPDFQGDEKLLKVVLESSPHIYNHNLETVPRLYDRIRPLADYNRSLKLLQQASELSDNVVTKSGIMLGLGEKKEEVLQLFEDLRDAGVDMITIGQYLQPTAQSVPVVEYVKPDTFDWYGKKAEEAGFRSVASAPLVRSSYHAKEDYIKIASN